MDPADGDVRVVEGGVGDEGDGEEDGGGEEEEDGAQVGSEEDRGC